MARRKSKPTLRDRQVALLRFFVVIHDLKLADMNNHATPSQIFSAAEWMAGKYEPEILKK